MDSDLRDSCEMWSVGTAMVVEAQVECSVVKCGVGHSCMPGEPEKLLEEDFLTVHAVSERAVKEVSPRHSSAKLNLEVPVEAVAHTKMVRLVQADKDVRIVLLRALLQKTCLACEAHSLPDFDSCSETDTVSHQTRPRKAFVGAWPAVWKRLTWVSRKRVSQRVVVVVDVDHRVKERASESSAAAWAESHMRRTRTYVQTEPVHISMPLAKCAASWESRWSPHHYCSSKPLGPWQRRIEAAASGGAQAENSLLPSNEPLHWYSRGMFPLLQTIVLKWLVCRGQCLSRPPGAGACATRPLE